MVFVVYEYEYAGRPPGVVVILFNADVFYTLILILFGQVLTYEYVCMCA